MEPLLRSREEATAAIRVRWELVHLLQLSVRSLEDTATRVVAAQLAGVIALWTQLYTFEEALPEALAWAAWGVVIVSVGLLGLRISPRRLTVFWQLLDAGWDSSWDEPLDEAQESRFAEGLSAALRSQRDRLQRAVRGSIALGVVGLALAALAYVVDKAYYGS